MFQQLQSPLIPPLVNLFQRRSLLANEVLPSAIIMHLNQVPIAKGGFATEEVDLCG